MKTGGRWDVPIRDLGLRIEGSSLEPIVGEFRGELRAVGITRVVPRFYLSTEWGVCEGTVAIAIPFYLASAELTALHAERVGHVEGNGAADVLRYLRHEMGHVVNYAYELFATAEWVETFGAMDRPYLDEFRLEPFSRKFVRHLPGWYAQKHPDEDWSETFAVWMTPGIDWRCDYADWPVALDKLHYCDRVMASLAGVDPVVTADALEEDVSELTATVEQFYPPPIAGSFAYPAGLDSSLRALFDTPRAPDPLPVSALIRRLEKELVVDVYRWTGHFPERTRPLLRYLATRADDLGLTYRSDAETSAVVGLTTFVTTLAMNHVHRHAYVLESD